MDYGEARAWLDGRTNLEATVTPGRVRPPSLDAMRELVHLLGDPQQAFPAIHLTGTNGKTTTARIVTRLLEVAGLSVGTFTSPDLERINERMAWNGVPIADEAFAEVLSDVAGVLPLATHSPSRFDILAAAAFRWFADIAVHVGVIEVGLLGRWDSTNVVDGQVAVVTNVGADHLDYAGTIQNVAAEKAGIVKPGSILVLGEIDPELAAPFLAAGAEAVWRRDEDFAVVDNSLAMGGRLLTLRTPTSMYEDLFLRLHGPYQAENASIALVAAEAFLGRPLDQDLVAEAFDTVSSPGRLEVMGRQPLCVLDGAHNSAGAYALAGALEEEFAEPDEWVVVLGVLQPHDPREFLAALDLRNIALVVACEPQSARAVPASVIAAAATELGIAVEVGGGVGEAVGRALASATAEDAVLVTGSLYVVGEARTALRRGVG